MPWSQRWKVSFSFNVVLDHRSLLPGQRGSEVAPSDTRKADFLVERLGWQKQLLATYVNHLAHVMELSSQHHFLSTDEMTAIILPLSPMSTLYEMMFKNWKELKENNKIQTGLDPCFIIRNLKRSTY